MRAELVLKRARRAIQTFEHSRCTRGARGRKKVGWFRAELHHFSLSLPLLSTTSVHHVAASLFPRGGAFLFASKAPVSSDDVSLLPFPPPHPKQRRVALSLPRSLYRLPFSACALRPLASPTCTVLLFRAARSKFLPRGWFALWREEKRKLESRNHHYPFSRPPHRWTNQLIEIVFHSFLREWFGKMGIFLIRRWWSWICRTR